MKKIFFLLTFLIATLTSFAQLTDWDWRREMEVENKSATDSIIASPIFFLLNGQTLNTEGKIEANYSDLRISIDCDGDSLLNHWIENNEASDSVVVWVSYPDTILPNTTISLFAFYGNPVAPVIEDFDLVFPNQMIITADGDLPDVVNTDWFEVQDGVTLTGATPEIVYSINAARVKIDGSIVLDGLGAQQSITAPSTVPGTGTDGFGGGGGGHGGNGGDGSDAGNGGNPGVGGGAQGNNATGSNLIAGAGGNGMLNTYVASVASFAGGNGGGTLSIVSQLASVDTISLQGLGGESGVALPVSLTLDGDPGSSGGGGGAGGGLLITTNKTILTGLFNANGGIGGDSGGQPEAGGGGGSGGRIKLFSNELNGAGTLLANGGAGGNSGTPGNAGQVGTIHTAPNNLSATASFTNIIETRNGLYFTDAMAPNYTECRGLDLTFTVTEDFTSYDFFLWDQLVQSGPNNTITTDTLTPGTYIHVVANSGVCINATDTLDVYVKTAPIADFEGFGFLLTWDFQNNSDQGDTYLWDFGDGNTSTDENPNYKYATDGTYTVCLTATNLALECTSSTICKDIDVVCSDPEPGYFPPVKNGLRVRFLDNSDFETSYLWEFGDGNSSTQRSPTHEYDSPGTYTVVFTVFNECGSKSTTFDIDVDCNFTTTYEYEQVPNTLDVKFYNTTPSSHTSIWDFGDGVTATGGDTVTHTFINSAQYNVCLTSISNCGATAACELLSFSCSKPTISFQFTTQDTTATFDATVNGNTTGVLWDFGDGNTSTEEDPFHAYEEEGIYNVCVTTENECGTASDCQQVDARCADPAADFDWVKNGYTYNFGDSSLNAVRWRWDFGMGTISTEQHPTFTFRDDTTRNYYVCLKVYNGCNEVSEKCKFVSVIEKTNPTGIQDYAAAFAVALYPNPVRDALKIRTQVAVAEVNVLDASGRKLQQNVIENTRDEIEISLGSLEAGSYFLEIVNTYGNKVVKRVSKL